MKRLHRQHLEAKDEVIKICGKDVFTIIESYLGFNFYYLYSNYSPLDVYICNTKKECKDFLTDIYDNIITLYNEDDGDPKYFLKIVYYNLSNRYENDFSILIKKQKNENIVDIEMDHIPDIKGNLHKSDQNIMYIKNYDSNVIIMDDGTMGTFHAVFYTEYKYAIKHINLKKMSSKKQSFFWL